MTLDFDLIWGLGVIAVGVLWMYKREIGVGIEGRAPGFYVSDLAAFVIGLLVVLLGIFILVQTD